MAARAPTPSRISSRAASHSHTEHSGRAGGESIPTSAALRVSNFPLDAHPKRTRAKIARGTPGLVQHPGYQAAIRKRTRGGDEIGYGNAVAIVVAADEIILRVSAERGGGGRRQIVSE